MLKRSLLIATAFLFVLFAAGTSYATKWGPTPSSFNYWAADSSVDGGNTYSYRTVTNSCKTIQLGFANQHDDSFESDDTSTAAVPLAIGFPFRFFGLYYTHLYVGTNGGIHLVNLDPADPAYNANLYTENIAANSFGWDMTAAALPKFANNTVIPTIAVWMEDMTCLNAQLLFGTVSGSTNECIVTYQNMAYFNSTLTSQIVCQVVLQSTGKILCQYYSTLVENDIGNGNADPGVGICGPDLLGNINNLLIYTRASNNDGVPSTYSCYTFVPPPPPPSITVNSPNGGELFYTSEVMTVSWAVANGPLTGADVSISRDGGFSWTVIATNVPDNNGGNYAWPVTTPPSTLCMVRVSDTSAPSTFDSSNNVFEIRIAPPGFTVTSPGGVSNLDYMIGDTMTISWIAVGAVNNAHLYISRDYGVSWVRITAAPINPKTTTSYNWVVTAPHTDGVRRCYIRIDDGTTLAVSQSPFAIFNVAQFTVTYPNGGETVFIDTPTKILWNTQGLVGFFVNIELSRDNGINWGTITGGTNNDGDFDWVPTAPISSSCLIRITTSYSGNIYTDTSNAVFTLSETAALAITSPNGGETYTVGQQVSISWNSRGSGVGNLIKIDISRDAGLNFETITDTAQNIGFYSWNVTGPVTDRALLRIAPVNNNTAIDLSDGVFEIAAPLGIYMLNPAGGEAYFTGEVVDIRWFVSGNTGSTVLIELSRNAGTSWETIVTDSPNDGSHTWVVTSPLTNACLIRVKSITYPSFFGITAGTFRISEIAGTNIVQPYAGDIWETGTYRPIRWKDTSFGGESGKADFVRIQLFRKSSGWEVIAISTENDGIYNWYVSVPDPECVLKISSLENLSKNYTSDKFSIIERYSLPYDAAGLNTAGNAGTSIPFRLVLNPEDAVNKFECSLNFNNSVFTIPEVLAVVKGASFTGWLMDVNIDNVGGVLHVILSGGAAGLILPAEAFTVNFSTMVGATPGEYTITITDAKINNAASTNLLSGKINVAEAAVEPVIPRIGGGGGGCFIATAAFASISANSVTSLCDLRDSSMLSSGNGCSVVNLYYAISPCVAGTLSSSMRALVRDLIQD